MWQRSVSAPHVHVCIWLRMHVRVCAKMSIGALKQLIGVVFVDLRQKKSIREE